MSSRPSRSLVEIFVCAVMVSACTSPGGSLRAVPVEVVYSDTQCRGTPAPSLARIGDEAALRRLTGNAPAMVLDTASSARAEFPAPATAWLLSVDMGERPSAGYALTLQRAEIAGGVLTLYADWQEPPPDALTAQVMTHPCVVVRVSPLDIKIKKMRVIDQVGRVRIEEDLVR